MKTRDENDETMNNLELGIMGWKLWYKVFLELKWNPEGTWDKRKYVNWDIA